MQRLTSNVRKRLSLADAVAAVLLLVALANGLRPVQGEGWPYLYDAMRDIGTAQVILEGRYPADNIYPSEVLWFNPLTGFFIAAASWLSGAAPPLASTQLGPWLNLLPALAFYLLCRWVLGAWGGAAALGGYLLWNAQSPAYAYATYTPWLFASHLANGFFCLALLCYMRGLLHGRWGWWVSAGVLHGLCFMAHTGPAVVLGCIVAGMALLDFARMRRLGSLKPAAIMLGVAFVFSAPFWLPIYWRYQMEMRNVMPALNAQSPMRLQELGQTAWGAMTLVNAVSLAGLAVLLRGRWPLVRRAVGLWTIVLLAWLMQVYLWQWLRTTIPQPVPAHHVHAGITLLRALCFGAGVACIGVLVASQINRRRIARLVVPAACIAACVLGLAGYGHWEEFTKSPPQRSPHADMWTAREEMHAWLVENASPEDAILSDDWLALLVAAPAGRGAVATMLIFSNPYVDAMQRLADRDRMFDALRAKDAASFHALAGKYGVRYILAGGVEEKQVRAAEMPFIREVFASPPMALFEVEPSRPTAPGESRGRRE